MTIEHDSNLIAFARDLGIEADGLVVASAEGYVSGFSDPGEKESVVETLKLSRAMAQQPDERR